MQTTFHRLSVIPELLVQTYKFEEHKQHLGNCHPHPPVALCSNDQSERYTGSDSTTNRKLFRCISIYLLSLTKERKLLQ